MVGRRMRRPERARARARERQVVVSPWLVPATLAIVLVLLLIGQVEV